MPLTARQYFTLRRLHSLTGVVPVGVFLLEHFFTNSKALQGAAEYNGAVAFLQSIPYLYLVEFFGIAVPIVFHAALGLWIAWQAKNNAIAYPYARNQFFFWQRVTGVLLVVYIAYHVATTRFAPYLGDPDAHADFFKMMHDKLQNPLVFAFYVLGVCAAAYHFGNGLWGFAIHWGILTGRGSQRRWSWVAIAISVAIAAVGVNSLLAFEPLGLRAVTIFSKPAEGAHVPAGEPALSIPAPAARSMSTEAPAR
jgi:succinate dehydrogenase / fumarate reductase cytochrome b subunit